MEIYKEECPDCRGEGGFEDAIGPLCGHGCDWCGGCYENAPCDTCEGTGEVDYLEEIEGAA